MQVFSNSRKFAKCRVVEFDRWFDRYVQFLALFVLSSSVLLADPLIVAHRGASAYAPENTLPAFQLAWEQGADAIEGDFHLTQDGQIVCIHDKSTKKVASKDLVVGETNLADLQKLDVGAYRGDKYKGVKIPTLQEVIETVPEGKKIYIEVKCGVEIIPRLLLAVGKSNLKPSQVIYISFDKGVIKALKAAKPDCRAYLLYSYKRKSPKIADLLDSLKEIGADGLSSNTKISLDHIKQLQNAGIEWHVWTVNDQKLADRVSGMGASSITTDKPDIFKK